MTGRSRPKVYVIGNVNVDLIMGPLAPWPAPGTENVLPEGELRVGGAEGNVALALRALGIPHRLICNVGNDVLGRWLARALAGGARRWCVAAKATTISVGVGHPDGERTFLTSPGHLSAMTLHDVKAQLPDRAQSGDIALLVGCFFSPRLLQRYEALIELLAKRGFGIALDTGWPSGGWSVRLARRVANWLGACDHVLLNEIESLALSCQGDVASAAAWLRRKAKPGAAVVIKQGPAGAAGWEGTGQVHVPAPRVKVIDTIGAGDAFDAGYLAARLGGGDLVAAVAEGVAVASAAISTSPRHYRPLRKRRPMPGR